MFYKVICLFIAFSFINASPFSIPIHSTNRNDISNIQLTEIGKFGLIRKARKTVPAHFHTGIDIKRPNNNYNNEPIFAIAEGKIISKRTDGPYAQLIIEHHIGNMAFWTVYEHIAGITANLHQTVTPDKPIARFMNKMELNKFGWQFDHVHLEILKTKPIAIKPSTTNPERYYNSYTLVCFKKEELEKYFHNPMTFLSKNLD